ncbi:MAG: hypothetical protein ACOVP4_15140 [Bacteriovoracaceae bacterium]|jgi:hypothetical protein
MKKLILLMLALLGASCTQKYVDYDVIRKTDFLQNPDNRPITQKVFPGKKDQLGQCFNQWLFFSNAETQKKNYLPNIVQAVCPGDEYLVDARITERWWTTIIFTQACVRVETSCPIKRPKN